MKNTILLFLVLLNSLSTNAQTLNGTWISSDESPVTLILTEDGFKVMVEDIFMTQQANYGTWWVEGTTFHQQFFGGNHFTYEISNQTDNSFELYSQSEDISHHFEYTGAPQLSQDDQTKITSEVNFAKLKGTWEGEGEVLKFMGDGFMFYTPPNAGPQCALYSVLGNTLRLQFLDNIDGSYFFTAEIQDVQEGNLQLVNNANSQTLSYLYQGTPQLVGNEKLLYNTWVGINHRVNMTTIDAMDGTTNIIWKEAQDNDH